MRFFPYLLRWTPPVTALALCVFACSDGTVETTDDDADAADRPALDGGHDASRSEEDAGVVDASPDAANEVDAAPARTCTDEGWCHIPVPGRQTLNAVWGDGQGTAWAVSLEGQILRWDGAAWTRSYYLPVSSGAPALHAIWGSGPTDIWVGGDRLLLHGTGASPETLTWSKVELPSPVKVTADKQVVHSIWGAGASTIWAVAGGRSRESGSPAADLLRYVPPQGGTAGRWEIDSSFNPPSGFSFYKVFGTGPDDVWAAGVRSNRLHVFRRSSEADGTTTWVQYDDATARVCTHSQANSGTAFAIAPSTFYLFGSNVAYCSIAPSGEDDGTITWKNELFPSREIATGAQRGRWAKTNGGWAAAPDDVWVVGDVGRIYHWDGSAWRAAGTALSYPVVENLNGIWGSSPNDIWVVGQGISLHKGTP